MSETKRRAVGTMATSEMAKRGLLGGGLLTGSLLGAGCALGCLLLWIGLAVVIVLLWSLVALLGALAGYVAR